MSTRDPECGKDFCDHCGDCLACYGSDLCVERGGASHLWEVEPDVFVEFTDSTPSKEPAMQRVPVESSNVRAVGYDPATKVLEVEFHGGNAYAYDDVPPEVHEGLMAAGSVGRYFNANVKSTYTFRKL